MKRKSWIFVFFGIIILIFVVVALFFFLSESDSQPQTESSGNKIEVFYEKIPGSKNHSPDGTWWGYNMSKIARYGDTVFMYVVHNDDDPVTPSKFTIYKKEGEGEWEKGAEFPTSRPGNILIDSKGGFHLLPVQDDFVAKDEANIYQKIMYLSKTGKSWKREIIVDYSKKDIASSRRRLLEQSELYEDVFGNIHLIYKEYLGNNEYESSSIKHLIKRKGGWDTVEPNTGGKDANWVKLVEVDSQLYYISTTREQLIIGKFGSNASIVIDMKDTVQGAYPYISTPKIGTSRGEKYIDILLLEGDGTEYPNADNYYVRILKSEFTKIN